MEDIVYLHEMLHGAPCPRRNVRYESSVVAANLNTTYD